MGAAARCEGRCPSGAGRETWLLLPEVEGLRPHAPIGRALRPIPREFMQGWQPQHPPFGRSAPNPGLLSCEKKVGKDSPKPAVLDSLVREDRPYRAALRLHTGSSQPLIQTDLPLWAGGVNWSCFLPAPYRGYTFSCQSVARQVYCSRGYLRVLLTATNTTRAEAGGIQGGSPPCAGGQDFFEV